jgi:adenine deaminase
MTCDFDIVVRGTSPRAMAAAVNRVLALTGRIAPVEGSRGVQEWPLPRAGIMERGERPAVAQSETAPGEALARWGYADHDPLFTLHLFPDERLPAVRLSLRGVRDLTQGKVLLPSRRR